MKQRCVLQASSSSSSSSRHHAVIVSTIDNLLKGAATQAVQNTNIALGMPEYMGIFEEES